MSILDKVDYIQRFDSNGALDIALKIPSQLDAKLEFNLDFNKEDIENVVVCGMGGSALAASICQNWWQDSLDVPFEVIRGHNLPAYVGSHSLIICSSYSGNTEETISCFNQAIKVNAKLVVVTSGGELGKLASENKQTLIKMESGYQPRMAMFSGVRILADIFAGLNIVKGAAAEIESAKNLLLTSVSDWHKEITTDKNLAKQIAEELMGKAIWVYASDQFSSASYKWKIGFNENAKTIASYNVIPELNHNELIGWTSHPVEKPFAVVELRSHLDSDKINKRFDEMNNLLSGRMPAAIEIDLKGQNIIEQLLWASALGEFVSIYLGILHGVNPMEVDIIEKFKQRL
ncbi:MAG: bifunctional phosphoglucose/phosphomannose isomerase [Candidatus Saccharimonadales bacterium]